MKRILLFALTNLAVLALLSVILFVIQGVFGVQVPSGGMAGLLVFAALFGFGGALVSLALSKWTAKRMMGVQVIRQARDERERWLLSTVARLASHAGIGLPEVGVFEAEESNAFATGARRDAALVAVSSGLLRNMSRPQIEAVLGHEVTHVANGDMVTLALLQGVLNTFVIVLARVVGGVVDSALSGNRDGGRGFAYYIIVFALEMVFGLFATMIAMWFSRHREFRADAGGAHLAGRNKMIAALERLSLNHGQSTLPSQVQAFGIAGGVGEGLRKLFLSHPPLTERIAALRAANTTVA